MVFGASLVEINMIGGLFKLVIFRCLWPGIRPKKVGFSESQGARIFQSQSTFQSTM
jgi:hypothetical protein